MHVMSATMFNAGAEEIDKLTSIGTTGGTGSPDTRVGAEKLVMGIQKTAASKTDRAAAYRDLPSFCVKIIPAHTVARLANKRFPMVACLGPGWQMVVRKLDLELSQGGRVVLVAFGLVASEKGVGLILAEFLETET